MTNALKNSFSNLRNGMVFILVACGSLIGIKYFFPDMLTTSNIMTLLLGVLLFTIVSDMVARGETVAKYLTTNVNDKMENIALFSTATEVVGLALIAMDRGMDSFNASTRYGLTGGLELMSTFLFMYFTTKLIDASFKDWSIRKFKSLLSILGRILVIGILFIVCLFPTWVIAIMYMESIGSMKLIFADNLSPINMVKIVKYKFDPENPIHPEFSALFMIWLNPFLNFFQIVFYMIEKTALNVKAEPYVASTTTPGTAHVKITDLNTALKRACEIIATDSEPAATLYAEAKSNLAKMFDPASNLYNPQLKSGSKLPKDLENDLLSVLNGSDTTFTGIEGFVKLTNNGSLTLKSMQAEIERLAKEIAKLINEKEIETKKPTPDQNNLTRISKEMTPLNVSKNNLTKDKNKLDLLIDDLKTAMEQSGFFI
jgi:hypothetical protein